MWPVVGIDSSMPVAMSGSRPIVTNSVVPIAKPPRASARIARPTCEVRRGRSGGRSHFGQVGGSSGYSVGERWHAGPMRRITVEERRARLGVRHALAGEHGAPDVVDAARAVVGLHGTDPASTFLAALARTPGATTDDVERALYDDRTLVRVLAMRRTLFAVPREHVGIVLVGAGADIGRQQRTLLEKMLVGVRRHRRSRPVGRSGRVRGAGRDGRRRRDHEHRAGRRPIPCSAPASRSLPAPSTPPRSASPAASSP